MSVWLIGVSSSGKGVQYVDELRSISEEFEQRSQLWPHLKAGMTIKVTSSEYHSLPTWLTADDAHSSEVRLAATPQKRAAGKEAGNGASKRIHT